MAKFKHRSLKRPCSILWQRWSPKCYRCPMIHSYLRTILWFSTTVNQYGTKIGWHAPCAKDGQPPCKLRRRKMRSKRRKWASIGSFVWHSSHRASANLKSTTWSMCFIHTPSISCFHKISSAGMFLNCAVVQLAMFTMIRWMQLISLMWSLQTSPPMSPTTIILTCSTIWVTHRQIRQPLPFCGFRTSSSIWRTRRARA